MAVQQISFSDPLMAQQLRQQEYDVATGTADLRLEQQRLEEDTNLFRPYLKRRFGQQAESKAGSVADKGFHGEHSGVMRGEMKSLAEEQTFAAGQYERKNARAMTDIERAIANLSGQGVLGGAESVRGGAGRLAEELVRLT